MLFNAYILINNKLIETKFIIFKQNNKIIINITKKYISTVKIPISNKYLGIYYEPIKFPMEFIIDDNKLFSPYFLFYDKKINLEFDFLNTVNKIIAKHYKMKLYNINDFEKIEKLLYLQMYDMGDINIENFWNKN
jgi:hypothetical protein